MPDETGERRALLHTRDMNTKGVTKMHTELSQPFHHTQRPYMVRADAERVAGRFLKSIATMFRLLFLSKDTSLDVESLPAQRQQEAARRHLWPDRGDRG